MILRGRLLWTTPNHRANTVNLNKFLYLDGLLNKIPDVRIEPRFNSNEKFYFLLLQEPGEMFDWPTSVDYSVLDTIWFDDNAMIYCG